MKPLPTFEKAVLSGGLNDSAANQLNQPQSKKLNIKYDESPEMVSAHILRLIEWAYNQLESTSTTLNK